MPDTIKHTLKVDTTIVITTVDTSTVDNSIIPDISVKPDTIRQQPTPRVDTTTDTFTDTFTNTSTINDTIIPDVVQHQPAAKVDNVVTPVNWALINDSLCAKPDAFSEMYVQADTVGPIKVFEAKAADVYGYLSVKNNDAAQVKPYTTSTLGIGETVHSPIRATWLDVVALGLLVYVVLVMAFTRRFLSSLFTLLFNNQKAHKEFENDSQSYSYSRRLFFVPSILVFSVYLFFAQNYTTSGMSESDLSQFKLVTFLYITAGVCGISVFKHLFLWLIGYISLSREFIAETMFNRQMILIAATIFLFPITVLLPLHHEPAIQKALLIIGIVIVAIAFVSILIRSLMLFHLSRVSLFLWILYLCILEIAPYLALIVLFQ